MTTKNHGGRRTGAGRKKIGEERGGLVPIAIKIYADQDARLSEEGEGKGWLIRAAIDELIAQLDNQKKTLD